MTEADTAMLQQKKNIPISGTASEVGGTMSATMVNRKHMEIRIVISAITVQMVSTAQRNKT